MPGLATIHLERTGNPNFASMTPATTGHSQIPGFDSALHILSQVIIRPIPNRISPFESGLWGHYELPASSLASLQYPTNRRVGLIGQVVEVRVATSVVAASESQQINLPGPVARNLRQHSRYRRFPPAAGNVQPSLKSLVLNPLCKFCMRDKKRDRPSCNAGPTVCRDHSGTHGNRSLLTWNALLQASTPVRRYPRFPACGTLVRNSCSASPTLVGIFRISGSHGIWNGV